MSGERNRYRAYRYRIACGKKCRLELLCVHNKLSCAELAEVCFFIGCFNNRVCKILKGICYLCRCKYRYRKCLCREGGNRKAVDCYILALCDEPFTANQNGIESVTSDAVRKNLNGMKLVDSVSISGYSVSATFSCTNQAQPSQYVRALIAQGYFENITYNGYAVEVGEDKKETITFGLTMLLKAGNDVTINKDDANSMIENEANGDQTDDTSSTESTAQ